MPALNYSWVLSGEGTMLRQEGVNVVANNSDNTAATISVGNTTSDADTGRWLALYESQQKERAELVAIISKLTDKLTALLTAGVAVLLLSAATACNKKDNGCHWEAVPTTHYVRALDYAPATTLDSTLYCDGVAVVTRTPSWAQ